MEKTKKIILEKTIEYQKGSIVSNTIMAKKTGTFTTFAFDRGQFLSEHTAPFDAIVYIIKGKGAVTISGKKYILKGGEMIIMPGGQPHSIKALEKLKMALIMMKS